MKKIFLPLEILFSIVIIVIFISIITLICLQIKSEVQIINKNSEASLILSNILENMNTRSFENIEKYIDDFSGIGVSKKIEDNLQNIVISGDEFSEKFFGTTIPKGYTLEVNLENNTYFDILKNVDLSIKYDIKGKSKVFEINTILEREKITECNKPILTDEYFLDVDINSLDYYIYPIKYSDNNDAFVITTKDDTEWYNYSSKKWAKVLVLPKNEELEKLFIDEHDKINYEVIKNNQKLKLEDYIYVWIPNFSKKENISYFRYGTGKKAIKMDFLYSNNKYLYLNKIAEEIKDISEDCTFDGISGVWRKLYDTKDSYYDNFNKTRFAPINIY